MIKNKPLFIIRLIMFGLVLTLIYMFILIVNADTPQNHEIDNFAWKEVNVYYLSSPKYNNITNIFEPYSDSSLPTLVANENIKIYEYPDKNSKIVNVINTDEHFSVISVIIEQDNDKNYILGEYIKIENDEKITGYIKTNSDYLYYININ